MDFKQITSNILVEMYVLSTEAANMRQAVRRLCIIFLHT